MVSTKSLLILGIPADESSNVNLGSYEFEDDVETNVTIKYNGVSLYEILPNMIEKCRILTANKFLEHDIELYRNNKVITLKTAGTICPYNIFCVYFN